MRNQILITLDSLRWDVFNEANLPFMKSYTYGRAWSHATYTLPAHNSFFTGKLPHSFSGDFDWAARSHRKIEGKPLWRLSNPETPGPGKLQLEGKNLIDAFNQSGFVTIGTGGVNWFNTNHPAHISCLDYFEHFQWFGAYIYGPTQIKWCLQMLEKIETPVFIFINFGETHHTFRNQRNMRPTEYGDYVKCFIAQKRSVEFLDTLIAQLFDSPKLSDVDAIICGDHGECFGEDGLWGHGFYHPKVMEVPLVLIEK